MFLLNGNQFSPSGMPSGTDLLPFMTNGNPFVLEFMPFVLDGNPFSSDGMPSGTDLLPFVTDLIRSKTNLIRSVTEFMRKFPVRHRSMLGQGLPVTDARLLRATSDPAASGRNGKSVAWKPPEADEKLGTRRIVALPLEPSAGTGGGLPLRIRPVVE